MNLVWGLVSHKEGNDTTKVKLKPCNGHLYTVALSLFESSRANHIILYKTGNDCIEFVMVNARSILLYIQLISFNTLLIFFFIS